jgi:TatD DNase family protein
MNHELIDAHAHLTYEGLIDNIEAVLARSREAGVGGWITVGTTMEENRKAVALAERFEGMYAAVGFHPHYAKDITSEEITQIKELAKNPKVVAIGETGLDFHYNFSKQPAQKEIFRQELELAAELNLPVIVHSRNAFDETMEILAEFESDLTWHGLPARENTAKMAVPQKNINSHTMKRVVFHCFGGDAQQAKYLVERGYYISFTGVVTFKTATIAREAVAAVPLDRMMIETDCPYMSPEPMRKQKINEPALMIHTAAKIAEIKGVSLTEFAAAVTATTKSFFGLKA